MITEEDFAAVADCPRDLAFARLEKKFRHRLENNLENSQNNNSWADYIIEYMNHTHAAAEALGLDFLDLFSLPDEDNTSSLEDIHNAFLRAVDNYTVRAHIRNVRHGPSTSLPLDEHDKKHIRAYVTRIKEIADGSALEIGKKEALLNKLNAFLADRTSMQRFSDFIMGLAKTTAVQPRSWSRRGNGRVSSPRFSEPAMTPRTPSCRRRGKRSSLRSRNSRRPGE
ncbi:hypothetical protein QNJ95_37260 [Bradyrhizobium elkanii]|uniref:hypothetical protein n=1 Tax=Bradyrhizobium elkanii TaxID=29448 RepID=UPI002711E7D3|nr:hypothetical protein [Bradyrhizobium elkanii]WLA38529.1 hypothetical protein QNJ95_37260 [Bradyrhizobium elkanii]